MIIDKGISNGDVVTIKLNSGEELIASFLEENDKYVKALRNGIFFRYSSRSWLRL